MEDNKSEQLNPRIKKVPIGIRSLREITIYPLSMADQMELINVVSKAIAGFYKEGPTKTDTEAALFIIDNIKTNFVKVLNLVTDSEELGSDVLKELSNEQTVEIIDSIYEMNFGIVTKKVQDLLEKTKVNQLLRRSSAMSLGDTLNTDLSTSSEGASEKED